MSRKLLDRIFVTATGELLDVQNGNGSLSNVAWSEMAIHCWALCYSRQFEDNPHYRGDGVLRAIIELVERKGT